MKVYVIHCFFGGQEWEVLSIWSTREKAEAEKERLWETNDNGIQTYGYELEIHEQDVDPEHNTETKP